MSRARDPGCPRLGIDSHVLNPARQPATVSFREPHPGDTLRQNHAAQLRARKLLRHLTKVGAELPACWLVVGHRLPILRFTAAMGMVLQVVMQKTIAVAVSLTMRREQALRIALAIVGLLFSAAVYPLVLFFRQEPA